MLSVVAKTSSLNPTVVTDVMDTGEGISDLLFPDVYCCFCHAAVVFHSDWNTCISSQFVPIHSLLISSIVDFVWSSDQTTQELTFSFLEFPTPGLRSELNGKFFLLGDEGSFVQSGVPVRSQARPRVSEAHRLRKKPSS